ncbi:hypothetical protein SAMN05216349_12310 [Oribacterium sp. KHPX15]|uniref:helix-turn-helix domain-containing protein n=1 Tax=Oribacterium sp. KHPX15 TaxID=1855342 RepID=UPI00089B146B|nr:helix-turn-helix transcriptional regulator [Oribacterium sp. KHPX15]SEA69147.1 hypothetical protein SAMN05216349_12310 [Oribacterium sp. KHPX15]
MIISTQYTENGVEKNFDHLAYVEKLKESHYSELKNLIRKAIGLRTQAGFAKEIGMSKEYLNRILKEGSDILPSNRMLEEISRHTQDKSVTLKELLICAGRTPASERLDDRLKTQTRPSLVSVDDNINDVYTFKKNMVEFLIKERDKKTNLSPKEYTEKIMSEFIGQVKYSAFDFECFYNECDYKRMEDWTLDCSEECDEYARDRFGSSTVVKGYVTAVVSKRRNPDEWVRTKVDFAFIFKTDDESDKLIVVDTDWDIPQHIMEEPEFIKINVENTYSLKDYLEEETNPPYIEVITPDTV